MNGEYDNTNRGALFRNEDKRGDSHPDYKGSINVNGVEFWLSAWLKESKKGTKYMSLSVQPKEQRQPRQQSRDTRPAPPPQDEFDDDIPF